MKADAIRVCLWYLIRFLFVSGSGNKERKFGVFAAVFLRNEAKI